MAKKRKQKLPEFNKENSFFFKILDFKSYVEKLKNKNELKITEAEMNSLTKEMTIKENETKNMKNEDKKSLMIQREFFKALNDCEKMENTKTEYGENIMTILDCLKKKKKTENKFGKHKKFIL